MPMFPDADPIHCGTARIPCPACGVLIPLEVFGTPSGETADALTVELSTDLGPAHVHAETCSPPVDEPAPEPTPEPTPDVAPEPAPEAPASDQTGSTS